MSNTAENNESSLLFKVRQTVLKTLKDRGYVIPLGATKLSFDDFKILVEKERHHIYLPDVKPVNLPEEYHKGGGILIYFVSSDKFDKKIFQGSMVKLNKDYPDLDKLFFVLKTYGPVFPKKLNNFVKTELQKHPNVEVLENIYPFDFMKNRSVPSCFLLSENEKNAVIKFLETPIHKFPKIDSTDPVAERFGAKIGDMIYIKRYGGSELTYRVVIKPGSG